MRDERAARNRGFCRCGSRLRYKHCCKGRDMNPQHHAADARRRQAALRTRQQMAQAKGGSLDSSELNGAMAAIKRLWARVRRLRKGSRA